MSRFFPHASYAEDQPLARTILLTHILTRGVTTGSILGVGIFTARELIGRIAPNSRLAPKPTVPSTATRTLTARLLRSVGRTTTITLGLVTLATIGRMWGREEIEWKDRSWRLLESQGQLETDDWTYAGTVGGLAAGAFSKGGLMMAGWRGALGAAGLGSVVGTIGYVGWRYGVNGGKFPARM